MSFIFKVLFPIFPSNTLSLFLSYPSRWTSYYVFSQKLASSQLETTLGTYVSIPGSVPEGDTHSLPLNTMVEWCAGKLVPL